MPDCNAVHCNSNFKFQNDMHKKKCLRKIAKLLPEMSVKHTTQKVSTMPLLLVWQHDINCNVVHCDPNLNDNYTEEEIIILFLEM